MRETDLKIGGAPNFEKIAMQIPVSQSSSAIVQGHYSQVGYAPAAEYPSAGITRAHSPGYISLQILFMHLALITTAVKMIPIEFCDNLPILGLNLAF